MGKAVSIENQLLKHEIVNKKSNINKPGKSLALFIKLIVDKTLAFIALIVLFPLLLLVALLIIMDSKGPVIFKQKRNGLNNKVFHVWKFRTMRVMENGSDIKQAQKGDARITHIGNLLRKSSIDELPQLVNVLMGDMAIVGPRPHPVALNDRFRPLIKNYDQRAVMKPGLTGLAQIKGCRGPTETVEQMQNRFNYDIKYIKTWSLWCDVKIMLLTPYHGLISKNAF